VGENLKEVVRMGSIYIDFVRDPKRETQPIQFLTNELISKGWTSIKASSKHKDDRDYSRFKLEEGDLNTFKEDVQGLCIPFGTRAIFRPHITSAGQLCGGLYTLEERI
jgi:hypothetical protein